MSPVRVEICLGSSCFAKGSQRLAEAAAAWAQAHPGRIILAAHRCRDRCAAGPHVVIAGAEHAAAGPAAIAALLEAQA